MSMHPKLRMEKVKIDWSAKNLNMRISLIAFILRYFKLSELSMVIGLEDASV
jgi:hypothetical protein